MFVTALGQSNEPKGWKAGIVKGGVLMSTKENKILAENLSLPHSPVYCPEHSNCRFGFCNLGPVRFVNSIF